MGVFFLQQYQSTRCIKWVLYFQFTVSDQLLHQVSLDLSSPSEAIQSSVAYFFVFLTGELDIRSMSPRLKQQLYHGIIKMLSTVQTQAVQVNGLGEL